MHTLKSLALSVSLVCLIAALAALLPGCGGGTLTPAESAQHDADMAALAALQPADSRKTIQPVACAASGVACR